MRIQKGDVVRLAASVTWAEFGLMLCDDDGEMLEIDGVVLGVEPWGVNVRIRRMISYGSKNRLREGAISRWVGNEEVMEVIDSEARMWPLAKGLRGECDERDGKKPHVSPVFWTVGVEEMPAL